MTLRYAGASEYGARQVSEFYRRYGFVALSFGISFHLMAIVIYYAVACFTGSEIVQPLARIKPPVWILPPSIADPINSGEMFVPHVDRAVHFGTPVPVPDALVSDASTIPGVHDPVPAGGATTGTGTAGQGNGGGGGTSLGSDEISDPDPNVFQPIERMPVPVKQVAPEYPQLARLADIEGTVWVKILVDKTGRAKRAIIDKSEAQVFNDSAIRAAMQWVFTPGLMNSGAIAVWVEIPFRFRLDR